jgi:hypothetical protein
MKRLIEVDERTLEKARIAAEAQRMTLDDFVDFAIRYAAVLDTCDNSPPKASG